MEKDRRNVSLNKRLAMIAAAVFVPMIFALIYGMHAMTEATKTYTEITQSIIYANDSLDFKETMDYSAYLAVVRKEDFQELGVGEVTVNGIVTVNPYEAIEEMKDKCKKLSEMTSVEINRNEITRLSNTLNALMINMRTLEDMIQNSGKYEDNMEFLDENIYMLTTIVEEGIQDYIHTETAELQTVCELQEKHNARIRLLCILITALAIYAAAILTFRAFRSITEPVRRLCGLTEKVAEGDFKARSEGTDIREIQVLTDSFNNMTGEIGTLVDNIKEKEKNLHLMETRLLQEQINPHFLYNTLESITWMVEAQENEGAVRMISELAKLLRVSLSRGKTIISIKDELQHSRSYMNIQLARYKERFKTEFRIEKEIENYCIVKLVIQPILENAIYYGVGNMDEDEDGRIIVSGEKKEEDILITIEDNGMGMPEEVLEKILTDNSKVPKHGSGVGVINVHSRIRLMFGEKYGLSIESEPDEGTRVTIRIPAIPYTPENAERLESQKYIQRRSADEKESD